MAKKKTIGEFGSTYTQCTPLSWLYISTCKAQSIPFSWDLTSSVFPIGCLFVSLLRFPILWKPKIGTLTHLRPCTAGIGGGGGRRRNGSHFFLQFSLSSKLTRHFCRRQFLFLRPDFPLSFATYNCSRFPNHAPLDFSGRQEGPSLADRAIN